MVKRGPHLRPQASEGEAQHGLFCWTRCVGQGNERLHRFRNSKAVGAVFGLTPSKYQSGQIALGQPYSPPELARRHVDQHQVHGPAAKPVLGLRRRPGRQINFMAVETAHPRAMHRNLATMEADLALGAAPAITNATSAAAMPR